MLFRGVAFLRKEFHRLGEVCGGDGCAVSSRDEGDNRNGVGGREWSTDGRR